MQRLQPDDVPALLTPEVIDILAKMADETPQSNEWHLINEKLSPENFKIVMDRKVEHQKIALEERLNRMTEKERREEEAKWKKVLAEKKPRFLGNMGEPDTIEEYEKKYGKQSDENNS